ncbi:uncharacterized protein LOC143912887 [Arctopsyche grandis]|uniref:uncharacterized protein LOC143912887 n=1 Tax=Arctopsyche grandis TaxID=121162 RepID=UPI00406D64B8
MEQEYEFLYDLKFPLNVEDVCRTCLIQNQQMTPIFIDGENVGLHMRLMNASELQLYRNDGLPAQICNVCVSKTNQANQFKQQAKTADAILRQYSEKLIIPNAKPIIPTVEKQFLEGELVKESTIDYVQYEIDNDANDFESIHDENSNDRYTPSHNIDSIHDEELNDRITPPVEFFKGSNFDNEFIFKCDECVLEFDNEIAFNDHTKLHDNNILEGRLSKKSCMEKIKIITKSEVQEKKQKKIKTNSKKIDRESPKLDIVSEDTCHVCSDVFLSHSKFLKHMKNKHKIRKPFVCDNCGRSFTNKISLGIHIRVKHTRERIFKCTQCVKRFVEKRDLNRHMSVHVSEFICAVCGKTFSFKQSLNTHMNIHNRNGKHPCAECKLSFLDEYQLIRHAKLSHTGEKHECVHCHKVFPHKIRLRQHMLCHKNIEDRTLQCRHCPKKFNYRHHLKNHERTHTGSKPFLCSKCGKGFAQSYNLTLHQRQHEEILPYPCNICEKSFAHPQRLQRHLNIHTGQKPFMCSICGKRYNDITTLKKHLVTHDEITANVIPPTINEQGEVDIDELCRVRPVCEICHIMFKSMARFKTHMKIHNSKYVCDLCNKAFMLESIFEAHLKTHNLNQKWHSCAECGMKFTGLEELTTHSDKAHSTQRSFKCSYCPQTFSRSEDIDFHLRKHSGEKPYMCYICHKTFAIATDLASHIRNHLGEKCHACKVCSNTFTTPSALAEHVSRHITNDKDVENEPCNMPLCTLETSILDNPTSARVPDDTDEYSQSDSNMLILDEGDDVGALDSYEELTGYVSQRQSQIDNNIESIMARDVPGSGVNNSHNLKIAIFNSDGTIALVDKDLNQRLDENNKLAVPKTTDGKIVVQSMRIVDGNAFKMNSMGENSHVLDIIGDESSLKLPNYSESDIRFNFSKTIGASRSADFNARTRPMPNDGMIINERLRFQPKKTSTSEEIWSGYFQSME